MIEITLRILVLKPCLIIIYIILLILSGNIFVQKKLEILFRLACVTVQLV